MVNYSNHYIKPGSERNPLPAFRAQWNSWKYLLKKTNAEMAAFLGVSYSTACKYARGMEVPREHENEIMRALLDTPKKTYHLPPAKQVEIPPSHPKLRKGQYVIWHDGRKYRTAPLERFNEVSVWILGTRMARSSVLAAHDTEQSALSQIRGD